MKKASLFHKRNAALKSQYKNFPVLSYKNDLKTGQIFSSVQPVTRGMETFLFPVQQSGRSPDLQIIMHCPLPGCPVSFWHALPKYSDEFVQDSHLFPFSPNNRNLLSSDTLRFSMWSIFGNFYRYLFNRMSISFCVHTVNHYSVIVGKTLGTNPPAAVLSVLAPFSII